MSARAQFGSFPDDAASWSRLSGRSELLTMNFNGEVIEGNHPATFRNLAPYGHYESQTRNQRDHADSRGSPICFRSLTGNSSRCTTMGAFSPVASPCSTSRISSPPRNWARKSCKLRRRPRRVAQRKWPGNRGQNHSRGGYDGDLSGGGRRGSLRALQIGTPIPLTADESAKRQVEALPAGGFGTGLEFFLKPAPGPNKNSRNQPASNSCSRNLPLPLFSNEGNAETKHGTHLGCRAYYQLEVAIEYPLLPRHFETDLPRPLCPSP